MSITIKPVKEQSTGQFNGGAILENKPVVPGGNGNSFKPFSNLFYWANAWSDNGSTIGEHPHQAFEIMSFVLKGNIDHYDNKNKAWIPLQEGDVQIIRAGSGISHAERLNAGSQIFQIWFDPNLEKAMSQPASYNDYTSADFPVINIDGRSEKTYKGENAPIQMASEGVIIKDLTLSAQEHTIPLKNNTFLIGYLIEGNVSVDGNLIKKDDSFVIKEQTEMKIKAENESRIFTIELPVRPGYRTYAETHFQ